MTRSNVLEFKPRKRAEPPAAAMPPDNDGLSARANAIREIYGYPIDPPEPKEIA